MLKYDGIAKNGPCFEIVKTLFCRVERYEGVLNFFAKKLSTPAKLEGFGQLELSSITLSRGFYDYFF